MNIFRMTSAVAMGAIAVLIGISCRPPQDATTDETTGATPQYTQENGVLPTDAGEYEVLGGLEGLKKYVIKYDDTRIGAVNRMPKTLRGNFTISGSGPSSRLHRPRTSAGSAGNTGSSWWRSPSRRKSGRRRMTWRDTWRRSRRVTAPSMSTVTAEPAGAEYWASPTASTCWGGPTGKHWSNTVAWEGTSWPITPCSSLFSSTGVKTSKSVPVKETALPHIRAGRSLRKAEYTPGTGEVPLDEENGRQGYQILHRFGFKNTESP